MKVIIRINEFGSREEDRQKLRQHLLDELNDGGLTILPSYCDVFVIEDDKKASWEGQSAALLTDEEKERFIALWKKSCPDKIYVKGEEQ